MYSVLAFADSAKTPAATVDRPTVEAAAQASLAWLKLFDQGKYGDSWDKGSSLLKGSIEREGWVQMQNQTHKPFGSVIKREVADERFAKNPHGLPPGDYMVMVYRTTFSNKKSAIEIVTLFLEKGHWSVVTYQAS